MSCTSSLLSMCDLHRSIERHAPAAVGDVNDCDDIAVAALVAAAATAAAVERNKVH